MVKAAKEWAVRLAWYANALAAMGLVAAYLSGYVSPARFWPLAIIGLAYPMMVAGVLLFAGMWALRGRWVYAGANIALVLLRLDLLTDSYRPGWFAKEQDGERGIKVMTYNVRMFDRFILSGDEGTRPRIMQLIKEEQPDILCVQELYHHQERYASLDTLALLPTLGHHRIGSYVGRKDRREFLGVGIFTGFPILQSGEIAIESRRTSNLCLWADLLMDGDTVRVYNLHLQSTGIGRPELNAIDSLLANRSLEEVKQSRIVLSKLKESFIDRSEQVDLLMAHIRQCPFPIILCGDFNDTPASYSYQQLSSGLRDAFKDSGRGFGFTYARLPLFRIDHVLHSSLFVSSSHTVHPDELSDHLAVTAVLHQANGR